jgi:uncharacterized protein Veg
VQFGSYDFQLLGKLDYVLVSIFLVSLSFEEHASVSHISFVYSDIFFLAGMN